MDHDLSDVLRRARLGVDALRARLQRQHGVCRIDVRLQAEPDLQRVVVRGQVLVDRLRSSVAQVVAAELPGGWTVELDVAAVQGGPWFAVPDPVPLWDRHPGRDGSPRVVTVVHPEDGPLETLGEFADARLLRARCGTAGWSTASLGGRTDPPRLAPPHCEDPEAFVSVAREYLNTPYVLGGTDARAIDCSGLVQRASWRALGITLPRHSGDLWRLGAQRGGPPPGPGHLVFIWTDGESLRHVGIATATSVVHASLSRRRVMEDDRHTFVAGAQRLEHVPFGDVLAFGRRVVGAPNLLAAGFRLGG